MSGFESLHPVVQHHVVNTLGWSALRPLQDSAVEPLLGDSDALLLAPTAGGKTEAALFPILSRMATEGWRGTSVLYVAPLRALLNNLEHRVRGYAHWLGREASVRHGDTSQGVRRRQAVERPDVLLTTPESLESILVSATVDPRVVLADVRAVIVDEVTRSLVTTAVGTCWPCLSVSLGLRGAGCSGSVCPRPLAMRPSC